MAFGRKILGKSKDETTPIVYCTICQKKIGFTGYSPKKEWNMEGKLCSKCYGEFLGAYRNTSANHSNKEESSNQITEKISQNQDIICQECNNVNPSNSKFCLACGSKLQLKCMNCENKPPEGSKFCNQCGSSLV